MGTISLRGCELELPNPTEHLRVFFSLSKTTERSLPSGSVSVLQGLIESLDRTVLNTVSCVTLDEFRKLREKAIPRFALFLYATSLVAVAEIGDEAFPSIAIESLDNIERGLKSSGIDHFGAEASERVAFCIFTLKRIVRALPRMIAPVPESAREKDGELRTRFCAYMLVSQFHLICLGVILKQDMDIPHDIVLDILDGISASSLAYATLSEGLELRTIPELPLTEMPVWDDEDQVLLDESEHAGTALT